MFDHGYILYTDMSLYKVIILYNLFHACLTVFACLCCHYTLINQKNKCHPFLQLFFVLLEEAAHRCCISISSSDEINAYPFQRLFLPNPSMTVASSGSS